MCFTAAAVSLYSAVNDPTLVCHETFRASAVALLCFRARRCSRSAGRWQAAHYLFWSAPG